VLTIDLTIAIARQGFKNKRAERAAKKANDVAESEQRANIVAHPGEFWIRYG
jgi:hypothetical protein